MIQDGLLNPYGSADSAICGFGLVWFAWLLAVGTALEHSSFVVAPKVTECGSHLVRANRFRSLPAHRSCCNYGCCLVVTALLASAVDCFTF